MGFSGAKNRLRLLLLEISGRCFFFFLFILHTYGRETTRALSGTDSNSWITRSGANVARETTLFSSFHSRFAINVTLFAFDDRRKCIFCGNTREVKIQFSPIYYQFPYISGKGFMEVPFFSVLFWFFFYFIKTNGTKKQIAFRIDSAQALAIDCPYDVSGRKLSDPIFGHALRRRSLTFFFPSLPPLPPEQVLPK